MASDVQELTINYTEEDILLVKELDKEVLTKGAWSTVMYRYQDWDRQKEAYGPEKYTIRRYRKINNEYRQQRKSADPVQFWTPQANRAQAVPATIQSLHFPSGCLKPRKKATGPRPVRGA